MRHEGYTNQRDKENTLPLFGCSQLGFEIALARGIMHLMDDFEYQVRAMLTGGATEFNEGILEYLAPVASALQFRIGDELLDRLGSVTMWRFQHASQTDINIVNITRRNVDINVVKRFVHKATFHIVEVYEGHTVTCGGGY